MKLIAKEEGHLLSIYHPLHPINPDDTRTVLDELRSKHPPSMTPNPDVIIDDQPDDFHPVIFDAVDGEAILRSALRTQGSAGPSGLDANAWRRICTSFKSSSDICHSLALVAKRISTSYVDPLGIASLTACRLIALDKRPGVRPIGIGEVSRRIISKAILQVISDDVKSAAGSIQLCAGQEAGCEAGVHAMKTILDDDRTEGIHCKKRMLKQPMMFNLTDFKLGYFDQYCI